MTRDEAVMIIGNLTDADNEYNVTDVQDAKTMAIEAISEQRNVLDEMFENIKTEIDFIPTYGAKFADGSINVHVNKKDVLQIIDKYKAESEYKEYGV